MVRRVWAIAHNTFREAVRQKVLYVLLFFVAVLILFSLLLGQLSLHADTKVIKDMGLASIMIFGALIAISLGIGLVFKEVDRRTIYTILSKPVTRAEFVLGKYFGLVLTLAITTIVMTILLFGVLSLYTGPLDFALLKAIAMIFTELCILAAVAMVFSSYSSSFMSGLFCLSFLVIGHVTDDLAEVLAPTIGKMMQGSEGFSYYAGYGLKLFTEFLGNLSLDHFAINADVVHGVPVGWDRMTNAWLYAFCWLILLLSVAIWLFRRKDLQ